MACALIGGISLPCRDGVGGILEVKVKIHQGFDTAEANFTETSGVVAIASGSRSGWYTYNLAKETASLTEKTSVNVQNGTVQSEVDLKVIFNKLSAQIRNEIKVLAQNSLVFAVKDLNDVIWLVGTYYGADLMDSTAGTGTSRADRSGYEVSFKAKEKHQMLTISEATYDTLVT